MSSYRSDEEQVEVLRKWWQDNGRALLTGVVVAIVLVLGWDGWKQHQARSRDAAATGYQNLLDTVGMPGQKPDDVAYTTARHLAERLQADGSNTAYATYGALVMARVEVDRGDYAKAQEQLQWAVEYAWNEELRQLAVLRLAQALFAQGKADEALARLTGLPADSYLHPLYGQLRGDILLSRGERAAAMQAYQEAIDWLASHEAPPSRILEVKRDALKAATADDVVPLPGAAAAASEAS